MKGKAVMMLAICFSLNSVYAQSSDHEIVFCGEKIPVSDRFVADKLMNIIRKQINNVNLPELRSNVKKYFGIIEYYLKATGLPEDFKYLAIVESGFKNAVSSAGAAGFWQIMPATAKDWGLVVNDYTDERTDVYKATHAACKELARNYLYIRKNFKLSSWVLSAAAYNTGIGNIRNAIMRQGKDYFQMNLNAETAAYVYKIIAVKELFEYPEIYMKNFGYNVFNTPAFTQAVIPEEEPDDSSFSSISWKAEKADASKPVSLDTADVVIDKTKIEEYKSDTKSQFKKAKFISAQIIGKYKDFKDGDLVTIKLQNDLQVGNNFISKGTIMQWQGWKIDDRIYIDLGFDKNVILYDLNNNHGITFAALKKKELVILMVNLES